MSGPIDAIEIELPPSVAEQTMTPLAWRCVLVGALAGLIFGFDTAVIAGTTSQLRNVFGLSNAAIGVTVSSALWGTLIGAGAAGKPGDRFGASACLKWVAILFSLSGLGCALAWNWGALLVFRFLGGLAVGASSVLAPVYIAEIAPFKRRGALVGMFQLNIVLGILIAYLSNYFVGILELGTIDWRAKFGVTAIPAVVLLLMTFTVPQSPRWLVMRGRLVDATDVLRRLGFVDPVGEVAALRVVPVAIKAKLSWRLHRKPILLATTIAAFNQLTGINAILYYLNDIFSAAGYDKVSADRQAIIIGVTNLVFTAIALLLIDRLGRRTLLLIGGVGLAVALFSVAIVMVTGQHRDLLLWMLVAFIAAFAFSQGAVIWVYISEIFPTEVRARGQSVGSSVHWCMDAIIAIGFPVVAARWAGGPFVFFGIAMLTQLAVVAIYFPETKRTFLR